MAVNLLLHLLMFAILGIAVKYDIQYRRIPNWLTVALLVTGLAGSFVSERGVAVRQSMAGVSVGLAVTFVFFVIGAMGAGDVKLMAGLGAWTGPAVILEIFIVTAVIGLFMAVFIGLFQSRLGQMLRRCVLLTINIRYLRLLGVAHVRATIDEPSKRETLLPYAVPVFMATVMMQLPAMFRWEY